jgi:hypothetical protein
MVLQKDAREDGKDERATYTLMAGTTEGGANALERPRRGKLNTACGHMHCRKG